MNKQQKLDFWVYLVKGIQHRHALNWYQDIVKRQGREDAERFRNWVNKVNGRKVL